MPLLESSVAESLETRDGPLPSLGGICVTPLINIFELKYYVEVTEQKWVY